MTCGPIVNFFHQSLTAPSPVASALKGMAIDEKVKP